MSSIASSLRMLQSSVATFALQKSMGKDAESMAVLLADMQAGIPEPTQMLAPKAGSMDILV